MSISATTTHLTNGVTSVDCHKQVRSWRLLRSLMELLIPSCNCAFIDEGRDQNHVPSYYYPPPVSTSPSVITGTIFGYRRGKASFCIQANPKSKNNPILLEFGITTAALAREMQGGILRIALECTSSGNSESVLSTPLWTMYCNGRKVGYAVKRKPSKADTDALRLMSSVVVGAGLISGKELGHHHDDELMYLRANFESVRCSVDSESFHLIDPDGNIGQELSIFFYRSW
ncbi:F-box protein [Hibiscus syriacus]|uniref:F-box protein n=1 Tax=Hibiscus syriacus TaxID=106335 RepID=A0A6A3C5P7_HIBSY|nr:protein MIZU-KUSSEI 1-like [Hibiscus syriacus]KAE8722369.1 F-box protein [Hibiscus syriacus]